MRAAVVHEFGGDYEIEDRPDPEPAPGQVLVRVEASGLCHTDVHAAHGDWPVKAALPLVTGHEGVGIVTKVGSDADRSLLGRRVAIPWLGWACGRCRDCLRGRETLCLNQLNTGYSIPGSHATLAVAAASHVVAVPAGVDPVDAAPLTCAGVTTYKAVEAGEVRSRDLVAVFGVGGLGHLAVQYAALTGADVAAVDIDPTKLELAAKLGATHLVNAKAESPDDVIRSLGGADVSIALAASKGVADAAFRSLRRGGRLVLVGLPAGDVVHLPVFDTVLGGITVVGSIVGTRSDLAEVFDLHRRGRTVVISQQRPLDGINDAVADLLAGRVTARIVFRP